MKTSYFAVALAVVALSLAPASLPCQAGSVTYGFTEGPGAPNPGEIGATITLASPPASATSTWTLNSSQLSDILSLQIIDPALFLNGFVGSFPLGAILSPLGSADGQVLSVGIIDSLPANSVFNVVIEPTKTLFELGGGPSGTNTVPGTWLVSASVPEPASAVQAGIASAIGLALAAFRKRKEARRQRPVGPLDAIQ
jgi:hypothetical protein